MRVKGTSPNPLEQQAPGDHSAITWKNACFLKEFALYKKGCRLFWGN
jgi:hypothetical protein